MGKSKKIHPDYCETFDTWEHFEDEENFQPLKSKNKKVKKMKMDKPLADKKR